VKTFLYIFLTVLLLMSLLLGKVVYSVVLFLVIVLLGFAKKSTSTQKSDEDLSVVEPFSRKETFTHFIYDSHDEEREDLRGLPGGDPARWIPPEASVRVQTLDIAGGMIYLGDFLPTDGYGNDAALINPRLRVILPQQTSSHPEMGYWPTYETISSEARGGYLQWLARGRSDLDSDIGFVFLFFYGLERRLLVDAQSIEISEEERCAIIDEVERLRWIYKKNKSFYKYASNFLEFLKILQQPVLDELFVEAVDSAGQLTVGLMLGRLVAEKSPIPGPLAYRWAQIHPDIKLKTVARRCPNEFQEMFLVLYERKYGDGFKVRPNKRKLTLSYQTASPSLGLLDAEFPDLPDPFLSKGPKNKLSDIIDACTSELDAYSRFMGRDNDSEGMAALALLPRELFDQRPGTEQLVAQAAAFCREGPGLVPTQTLYAWFGVAPPEKIHKKDAEQLAILIDRMGFGLAPDVRYHHLKPEPDGQVVIFPEGHGRDFRPSQEYHMVGTIIRLGAMVSQIDGHVDDSEHKLLVHMVRDNRELTGIERESLSAFLVWSLRVPQKMTGLKNKLRDSSPVEKTAISQILIRVAHADGRLEREEIKKLEQLYVTLGLDKSHVMADLVSLAEPDNGVTVARREDESTHTIPQPVVEPQPSDKPRNAGAQTDSSGDSFQLDEVLIRIREEETRQVKGVLANIFTENEEEPVIAEARAMPADPYQDLDEAHKALLERLIVQETWERDAIHAICSELSLMVDGALEVLNEWAFERVNAPLIEDGDPVFVDTELMEEIQ